MDVAAQVGELVVLEVAFEEATVGHDLDAAALALVGARGPLADETGAILVTELVTVFTVVAGGLEIWLVEEVTAFREKDIVSFFGHVLLEESHWEGKVEVADRVVQLTNLTLKCLDLRPNHLDLFVCNTHLVLEVRDSLKTFLLAIIECPQLNLSLLRDTSRSV